MSRSGCVVMTLFWMIISANISDATLIGTDLRISNIFSDDWGPHSLSLTTEVNDLNSLLTNVNATTHATASLTGNLSTEATTYGGYDYVTATSKSWSSSNVYNNTVFGANYYLSLDYNFALQPGAYGTCGTQTYGNISVFVNDAQKYDINYQNFSSWAYNEWYEGFEGPLEYVVYSGPSSVNASQILLLGYLNPGESFILNYSLSTSAFGEEHVGSYASSSLHASVLSASPVPEPSTFLLLGLGFAGTFFLRRRMNT